MSGGSCGVGVVPADVGAAVASVVVWLGDIVYLVTERVLHQVAGRFVQPGDDHGSVGDVDEVSAEVSQHRGDSGRIGLAESPRAAVDLAQRANVAQFADAV